MERAWSIMGVCDSGVKKALSLDARSTYLYCEETPALYRQICTFSPWIEKIYQNWFKNTSHHTLVTWQMHDKYQLKYQYLPNEQYQSLKLVFQPYIVTDAFFSKLHVFDWKSLLSITSVRVWLSFVKPDPFNFEPWVPKLLIWHIITSHYFCLIRVWVESDIPCWWEIVPTWLS